MYIYVYFIYVYVLAVGINAVLEIERVNSDLALTQ